MTIGGEAGPMRNTKKATILLAAMAVDAGSSGIVSGATPPPPIARVIEGDRALGEYLSGECVTCHQLSGNYDGIPSIVGWPAPWLVEAMNDFKSHKRANPVMQTIAGRYSAEEIAALAVYFESLMKQPPR